MPPGRQSSCRNSSISLLGDCGAGSRAWSNAGDPRSGAISMSSLLAVAFTSMRNVAMVATTRAIAIRLAIREDHLSHFIGHLRGPPSHERCQREGGQVTESA